MIRSSFLFGMGVALVLAACGSSSTDGEPAQDTNDDAANSGGSLGTGGQKEASAPIGTGGKTGTGGSGGKSGAGGTSGTGGATGSGGSHTGGGGAGGTDAGTGGAAGGPPHVVTACSALGAVDQWEEVSAAAFHDPSNMETTCVGVNPLDQSVYAAAGNKTNGGNGSTGLYRSTDCGATWTKVSVSKNIETGSCFGFRIDPVQPSNMYYSNGYGDPATLHKSTDGGVTFTPLSTDVSHVLTYNFVDKLDIDPENHLHLVVTYHEECKAPLGPQCLSETTDGGTTWRQFKGPDSGFAEGNRIAIVGGTKIVYTSANGGWFTSDSGQTWEKVVQGWPADMTFASDVGYMAVLNSGIYVSRPGAKALGESWTLINGSGSGNNVAYDGKRIFASADYTPQPFSVATASNPTAWTRMTSPNIGRGTCEFAYEADHHILYSANVGGGLWRVVTQ
jgi:photosystem II stability/assembly factor-like uncharacterized protein